MRIEQMTRVSKTGTNVILRSPDIIDAEELLEYLIKSAGETNYLGKYPEEINMTIDKEKSYITGQLAAEKSFDIAAFVDGKLVGNATIFGISKKMKTWHRAGYGIGILKDYWNLGIGNMLTEYCLEYAKKLNYEQVELDVISDNKSAIHMYEKNGFKACGMIENAEKLKDGSYQDLLMMVCRL